MPESKPAINLGALFQALQRPLSGPLLITRFFYGLAFAILQSIFSLFVLERFNMSVTTTGFVLTYVGVVSVFTQAWLVGKLSQRFQDQFLIISGMILMIFGFLAWAFAPTVLLLLVSVTPIALAGGMLNTILSAALTKTVEPQEVGGILGLSTSIESFTRVLSPMIGGFLLDKVAYWAPGSFSALLMIVTLLYASIALKKETPNVASVLINN